MNFLADFVRFDSREIRMDNEIHTEWNGGWIAYRGEYDLGKPVGSDPWSKDAAIADLVEKESE